MKENTGKIVLPLYIILLPMLVLDIITFGVGLIFTGFLWIMLEKYLYKELYCQKHYSSAFYDIQFIGKAILLSIARRLVIIVGLIFLIVPGIYLAIRYSMAGFILIDRESKVLDAMNTSYVMTKGKSGLILRYYAYCSLAFFITIATLGILSPWTIIYIKLMKVELFKSIDDSKNNS